MKKVHHLLLATSCIAPVLFAPAAFAQDAAAADEGENKDEIVVTGTLIRGIAPAGSDVLGISAVEAKATGGVTTNQMLASLPQIGNFFNSVPVGVSLQVGSNGSNPISRPNLRNLPGGNTSGGAQTLVLLDGHRITPLGTQQLAVDPDFIAPLVISRVEAMTDGGSAVYGSDALGGVINFHTRDRFDGLQVDARYGIGDSYKSLDAGGIFGKDWGSGSAYVSYRYAKSDSIFGSDRDYVGRIDPLTGIPTGRVCAAGVNVSAGSGANARTYTVASGGALAQTAPITCDFAQDVAILPRLESHNVFGSFYQQLDENLRFDVKFYYANRKIDGNNGLLGNGQLGTGAETVVTLQPTNPNYRPLPVGDVNFGLAQAVRFSLAPVIGGRSATQETNLDTWNITPQLTYNLGSDWQARALFNYGRGTVDFRNAQINNPRGGGPLAALAATGALNPYAVTAANAAAITAYDIGKAKNEFINYRLIVDGPLFELPAGAVRVAVGAEYMKDNFKRQTTNANTFLLLPYASYSQSVKSLFGELQVPVLGGSEGGMSLDLSASGRYDKYNDVGSTFNPKFGLTFKPFDMLTLRGSWGKSFNAPTGADQIGVPASTAGPVPAAFLQFPPPTPGVCGVTGLPSCSAAGVAGVFLGGTTPGLTPQKATNWSAGFDFKPVDGVKLSATYYEMDLKGTIGRPVTGAILTDFYQGYPDLWIFQPTGQQVAAVLATIPPTGISVGLLNPTSTSQALVNLGVAGGTPVQVLLDTRVTNLGRTKVKGIDFFAGFDFETGFGSVDGRVAGNYRLSTKTQTRPGLAIFDVLAFNEVKYTVSSQIGTTVGNFRAQATWNYTPSYKRSANPAGQTRLASFSVINLYFKYDFAGEGLTEDLALSLNVNNVFDEDPSPFLDAGQPGYNATGGNGFTLGRVFQLGVTKKF
jgi:iron complex outermembrane receptor protein